MSHKIKFLSLITVLSFQLAARAEDEQLKKDLANPDVNVVKLTDHFKSVKFDGHDRFIDIIGKSAVLEGVVLGLGGTGLVIHLSRNTDEDKIIRKFVKKGFNVAAKAARVYLITDAATKIVLRFQDLDPTITALPGAAGWALRESQELALEAPERIRRIPSQAHEASKNIIKQFQGKVNE
ncbi:MAG: hypothetical protein KA116_13340 [Proteobacteria bacterium]|nr:hypothetical protein [Pseudomonadota bacterium]